MQLFKKCDPLDCSNYRATSLLSTFSKIFEKCVYKPVHSFLDKNNVIFMRQSGLRSDYFSNHTKVNLAESIKKYIDNDNYVCSVFIDLEKAFDTVDHQILLQILYHCGIRNLAHNRFRSYLSNLQQFSFMSGFSSELMSVKCALPQGCTLGPILLLLQ